ncbi:MAG: ribosome silencing factor [Nitrospirae bacterium]|nr:ribosome silencing factor [Nitrospirota bacterium]
MLCSGASHRQVQAVAEAVDKTLAEAGCAPLSVEGAGHANWILMDYTDVIVHIFQTEMREFYGLDQLWGDAKKVKVTGAQLDRLTLKPPTQPPAGRRRSVKPLGGPSTGAGEK